MAGLFDGPMMKGYGVALDIVILALVAAFLVYRLRQVLGERHEDDLQNRNNSFMPPSPPQTSPLNRAEAAKPVNAIVLEAGAAPGEAQSLENGLRQIKIADPHFDEKFFLKGARAAFEMILKAYAAGDLATLKPLLSDDLYHSFADDIRARQQRGETMEITVRRIEETDIEQARLERSTAIVSVRYVSEQVSIIRDREGQILSGSTDAPHIVNDHWVFSRNTRTQDPNWQLIETLEA